MNGQIRPARALAAKGRQTREKILSASREVFTNRGYFGASVSEITRRCGLSQGTFYQYFNSKDQVLLELTDQMLADFWDQAHALITSGLEQEALLYEGVSLVFHHTRTNLPYIRVLGDLELVDPVTIAYYDSLARFIRQLSRAAALSGVIRPMDPNLIAYGLIGIAQFQCMELGDGFGVTQHAEVVSQTMDLLYRGISGPKAWDGVKLPLKGLDSSDGEVLSPQEQAITQGQKTRQDLFRAAELIFGQHGFNRASISEITRMAGVAQGTFYVHFQSKQDLFEGVIRYLSRDLRRQLRRAIQGAGDRRLAEAKGMVAFYEFIRRHREFYRIVAESDAVSPESSRWYYNRLAEGYAGAVEAGVNSGDLRRMPVSFLVRALMGFNHMIGLKWLIWNSSPHAEIPSQLVDEAVDLILNGLSPA